MGKIRWTWWPFRSYEADAMAEYLEQRAAAGWHLKGFSPGGMRFEKGEPGKLHFFTAIVPGSSEFDEEDREEILSFREQCEAAGWELVCKSHMWQVFSRKDAVPEEKAARLWMKAGAGTDTDSGTGLEQWLKAQKAIALSRSRVLSILIVEVLFLAGFWFLFKDPVRVLASEQQLFCVLLLFLCMYTIGEELAAPFFWFRQAERCLKKGETVPCIPFRTVRRRGIVSVLYLVAFFIGFACFGGKRGLIQSLVSLVGVGICQGIITYIRENDEGTRGEKIRAYVVSAFVILFFMNMVVSGILESIPDLEEEPEWTTVGESGMPDVLGALGYGTEEVFVFSEKSPLGVYQKGDGVVQLPEGEEEAADKEYSETEYVRMFYYRTPVSPALTITRNRQYPLDLGDRWTVTEDYRETEAGVTAVKYKYVPAVSGMDDFQREEQVLYLAYSENELLALYLDETEDDRILSVISEVLQNQGEAGL